MKTMRRSRGSSLIEVLVAMLIVAIGLLGVAKLNLETLHSNQTAMLRSSAVMLSYSILDRLRANRDVAVDAGYDMTLAASGETCSVPGGVSGLAKTDLANWVDEIDDLLGEGACGGIACDDDGRCTVQVRWEDVSSLEETDDATTVSLVGAI
ncbi:type IV pilus modification protein PilV [Marinobacter bohaiensis]|uniref:type IV pilus modification protein PilV n=1 Tax=Marinobacter bohaiensis TaxID=2201898 RepID=UPI000DABE83D|nr:type IV pilus modification protein PilV [Marinobacter bohaiensis]